MFLTTIAKYFLKSIFSNVLLGNTLGTALDLCDGKIKATLAITR